MGAAGADEAAKDAGRLERLQVVAAGFIAPVTVISTLLFYFGYTCARAQYLYFGIDVDTIGLGTQDYVMRSPQPLLVPLLVLALLGVVLTLAHGAVRRQLEAALGRDHEPGRDDEPGHRRLVRVRRAARVAVLAGQAAMLVGVGLLFGYARLGGWGPYPLVTPLVLATGAATAGYGLRLEAMLGRHERPRTSSAVAILAVLAASVFWATATVAQWSGRGLAHQAARSLDRLPSVILDTKERLYLSSPGVLETALPQQPGQAFRYRYRHLRLLIEGSDRLFLVPDGWTASNSTLVVPLDSSVRLQFQFQNQQP